MLGVFEEARGLETERDHVVVRRHEESSKHVHRGEADLAATRAQDYDLPEPLEEVVPTLTH